MSRDLEKVTTHADQAIAKLLRQFKDKPRLAALVTTYIEQIQDLEDTLWDLYVYRQLDYAEDQQLDDLGDIVGQGRLSTDDDQQRQYIRARIRVNVSTGKHEELLAIILLIVGDSIEVAAREMYPKAVEFEANDIGIDGYLIWREFLEKAKAAGTNLHFIVGMRAKASLLTWGSTTGTLGLTTDQRPSSSTGATGGKTASIYGVSND